MSVETVQMFRILCDRCRKSAQDRSEYYAWAEIDQAELEADDSEWLLTNGTHFCPDCIEWDEEADAYVPKPALAETPR